MTDITFGGRQFVMGDVLGEAVTRLKARAETLEAERDHLRRQLTECHQRAQRCVELTKAQRQILHDLVGIERAVTSTQLEEAYDNPQMRFYYTERLDRLEKLSANLVSRASIE